MASLLSLSAEVQLMIFKLVMVFEDPITLRSDKDGASMICARGHISSDCLGIHQNFVLVDRYTEDDADNPVKPPYTVCVFTCKNIFKQDCPKIFAPRPSVLSILLVNKTLHKIALPVFYQENTFQFKNLATACKVFNKMPEDRVNLVRKISVAFISTSSRNYLFQLKIFLPDLKVLNLILDTTTRAIRNYSKTTGIRRALGIEELSKTWTALTELNLVGMDQVQISPSNLVLVDINDDCAAGKWLQSRMVKKNVGTIMDDDRRRAEKAVSEINKLYALKAAAKNHDVVKTENNTRHDPSIFG